ncbi:hypothetical protein QJS10_CPB13g00523 [Acorus calamus]|uniref:GH10 domain-containing protein n=1 Tax=Acorus calamus TaxID=4465 RepID=A0AAV9DH80_ACOCL|nr:hypothetical protein QJS10_CPB13g00523 [Acorus calamus]
MDSVRRRKIEHRISETGNRFIVAHNRKQAYDSFSQKFYLKRGNHYTFSAWVQVNQGNAAVKAIVKTTDGYTHVGVVVAESGCWSMIKGGLTAYSSSPAELYFESKNTYVDIWVDSVSLQPFTNGSGKARKRTMRLQAVDAQGSPLTNATVLLEQTRPGFPFGCAIRKAIIGNTAYQSWFASRFKVTVFEDEMKWYSTEKVQGKEDYSDADAMVAFAKQHGISIRGHNILWDDPKYQLGWVSALSNDQLRQAVERRITSVVSRYAGQVIGWDVMNENLHFSFFEDHLGWNASAAAFQRTHQLDPKTPLFMNDYNTIEEPRDGDSVPAKYLKKLQEIQSLNRGVPISIGLEGHFNVPNIPYMRSSIDMIAAARLPIWLTEVDVSNIPNQAQYLEEVLREGYAHPSIQGIVMWAGWRAEGCPRMCLTDNNFKNLPTGDVVDKLISEWKTHPITGVTDMDGVFEATLFHGDYDVLIEHPSLNSSLAQSFQVSQDETQQEPTFHVKLYA